MITPDILADYREWRAQQEDRIGTHSDDCHLWPRHERCMIHRLAVEVERLRNYPAKPGSSMLTDEERQAVESAANGYELDGDNEACAAIADTLRGLLERL